MHVCPASCSCASQHCSKTQDWDDEMIKVPNGVVCNNQRRGVLQVRTEHSSWESEGDCRNTPMRGCAVNNRDVWSGNTTENDHERSWILFAKSFHDEFMMSRWREPTVMLTRTSVLQDPYSQGPHNERARGNATRGRCESGARVQRRQGLSRTKAEETPLVPLTGQSNSAELV